MEDKRKDEVHLLESIKAHPTGGFVVVVQNAMFPLPSSLVNVFRQ